MIDSCVLGLQCRITREVGSHNFTRLPDLSWKRETSTWHGDKVITPLLISNWQERLNFHAPWTSTKPKNIPGIGAAFWVSASKDPPSSTDFVPISDCQTVALNFLYAAAEMERMALEVLNSNITGDQGTFEVHATESATFYRITYVPALLLLSLLCASLATIISCGLAWYNRRTMTFKEWREVGSVRLLVDAVDGLRQDPSLRQIQGANNHELNNWATNFHVRYSPSAGKDNVRLFHVPKGL
jgi:hypothetical protein